ncbi:flavodoxin family protein [Ruminococcus gauvreauii]|uniref:NAD(P)H-dependent oxidoreductase n=1 Tax=Ruminococcus gauvreauii TaxID=438033 RepID=A0ABY5VI41_9FIRM|nr:NAD(P)H-dependent oxidoreductase [Ruminococcus gauvreauii]UWP59977.1 NAD(P)H-dependent oxidoreductase [Ruminococcus gauvreauii]
MKISIIYVSQGGNTEAAAEYISEGILAKFPFIEVKLMSIRDNEVDLAFLKQSDAVIIGTPVYCAGMSWELKKWFDSNVKLDLSGKIGAAFVTAQSPVGGIDTAIMDIVRNMLLKKILVFSGAGEKTENKFQLGAVGIAETLDHDAAQFEIFGENVAQIAVKIAAK